MRTPDAGEGASTHGTIGGPPLALAHGARTPRLSANGCRIGATPASGQRSGDDRHDCSTRLPRKVVAPQGIRRCRDQPNGPAAPDATVKWGRGLRGCDVTGVRAGAAISGSL